jgi:dipeptidyl aminopeptidase/acylaminoacyl peptidase
MSKYKAISATGIFAVFAIAGCVTMAAPARAQSTSPRAQTFSQVAISPDGNQIAWVEPVLGEGMRGEGSAIYVQDFKSAGSGPRRIPATRESGSIRDESIAWAPDGKRIAFLSDAESVGQLQLYVADLDTGMANKLTSLSGYLADPRWSADGKLAVLFTQDAPRAAGPLMAMTPETGVVEDKFYEQRVTMVDVASGNVRQLSPPDMYVYEYDWAPDGKSFAAIAAHGAGDPNWWVAQLYTLTLAGGEMKSIYKPALQIAVPRWSPDGKNVAVIEGLMSDEGSTGGDIMVVSATGGAARNVTPGITASPSGFFWTAPDKILFTENIDGDAGISTLDLSTKKVSKLWAEAEVISAGLWGADEISLAADHQNSAVIRSSPQHPPELWAGSTGEWKQITRQNDQLHPSWGEVKSLHWMSDGLRIQGWLMYPKDYDPSKHYPMVVVAHGGPAAAARAGWPGPFLNTYELSTHGYFVLEPNPRGSFGGGEKFVQGNVKDFGYGDFRDILAGVDEVVKTLPVDNNRIGITGWSYGGYMTMWAITQTNRFRAAVAGAGLSNWQSYYGENDIDEWMVPYFGASVYDDPKIYAKSSPMDFIKNVKTPTLVLVGERDGEVPEPQSREFWHALKSLGVETQLVVYAGEGHAIRQPDHRRDIMQRMIGWFDHYLKPDTTTQPAK